MYDIRVAKYTLCDVYSISFSLLISFVWNFLGPLGFDFFIPCLLVLVIKEVLFNEAVLYFLFEFCLIPLFVICMYLMRLKQVSKNQICWLVVLNDE